MYYTPFLMIVLFQINLFSSLEKITGKEKQSVIIDMTFTSMSCPAMDFMSDDVVERLISEKDIKGVSINVVWDPPWNQEMLSQDGVKGLNDWGVIKWV